MSPSLAVTSAKGNRKQPVFTAGHTFVPMTMNRAPKRTMQFGSDLITTFLAPGTKNGKNPNNAWGRGGGERQRESGHTLLRKGLALTKPSLMELMSN